MSNTHLVRHDNLNSASKNFLRFICDLNIIRKYALLSLLLTFIASIIPYVFYWIISKSSTCTTNSECSIELKLLVPIYFKISVALLIALFAIAFISKIFSLVLIEIGGMWASASIHQKMVLSISKTRVTYFDKIHSGQVINRLISDYTFIRVRAIGYLADGLYAFGELISVCIVVGIANPLAAVVVVPVAIFYILIQLSVGPTAGCISEEGSSLLAKLLNRQKEMILGLNSYIWSGNEITLIKRIKILVEKNLMLEITLANINAWAYFWMGIVTLLFNVAVYCFVVYALNANIITKSTSGVVLTVIFSVDAAVMWLSMTTLNIFNASSILKRIYQLVDLNEPEALYKPVVKHGNPMDGIHFENFSMSYIPGSNQILKNINLYIPNSQITGVIGRTGSGKSSLVQSLFKMVTPLNGNIFIDSESIYSIDLKEIINNVGIVSQNILLRNGTILDNISSYGSSKELILKIIHDLSIPLELEKVIEGNGVNLSSGERQLIALIRISLSNKKFIILDEPTSTLSSEMESAFISAAKRLLAGKTVLMITHNPEPLRLCDNVYEMSGGYVISKKLKAEECAIKYEESHGPTNC